jgi:tRNA pseudouridine38-40 synthase
LPRYKLTIAYDGTNFCGWQKQEPFADSGAGTSDETLPVREGEDRPRVALRTVQHVIEQAVRQIVREPSIVIGASRTDAGVHAKGQVAAFSTSPWNEEFDAPLTPPMTAPLSEPARSQADGHNDAIEPGAPSLSRRARQEGELHTGWPLARGTDRLMRALNGKLPEDVRVVSAEVVSHHFDPIGDCTSKAYTYTMHEGLERPLWDRWFVHPVWFELNERAMHEAAQRLVGEHDFAAFAAMNHGRLTTVRTVFCCEVRRTADRRVQVEIAGSGFLYNMVRIVAGTLVEVGKGRMSAEDVSRVLASKDRKNAGPTLPPTGLCLDWIRYGDQTSGRAASNHPE